MNAMKKLFALLMALALVMSLAVPAMAADKYTITIDNAKTGHVYEAYQIFAGDLLDGGADSDPTTNGLILSSIRWGSAIIKRNADGSIISDNSAALIAALKSNTDEIKYKSGGVEYTTDLATIFSAVNTEGDAAADQISGILSGNLPTEVIDKFAEVVGKFDGGHTYLDECAGVSTYSDSAKKYTISNLDAGYYLIKDQEGSLTQNGTSGSETANHDAYTKFMLQVVHSFSIAPKSSVPSVKKEINKTIGGTYSDALSFDIADDVYFKWTGYMPENLAAYDQYYYKFEDSFSPGFNVNADDLLVIEIQNHDGDVIHTIMDKSDNRTDNDNLPTAGVTLSVTPAVIREVDSNGVETVAAANGLISLEFADLKALYPLLASDDMIIVKYKAMLNRHALISDSNTNSVQVVYSNNPSGSGVGTTIPDYANAFTHSITVDKYEKGNESNKLSGVEFYLYYTRTGGSSGTDTEYFYAKIITEEMVEAGELVNGKAVTDADVGVVYGWTNNRDEAAVLDTDEHGAMYIKGLDTGTYYLEEIKTNEGFNLPKTDVRITVEATYKDGDTADAEATVHYKVGGAESGTADNTVAIENSRGNTLPSTGGIGTTLFYVGGGILALAAIILLITKKRMSN